MESNTPRGSGIREPDASPSFVLKRVIDSELAHNYSKLKTKKGKTNISDNDN